MLAYAPPHARSYFARLAPDGFGLLPQQGAHLGERLAKALAGQFQQGWGQVVIMNSDGPTLPLAYLEEAFSDLDRADATLDPGHDGGYYLIGMKRLHPELFQGIAWSTDRVVPQTLAICRRLRLRVRLLPEWYDVDVGADLVGLRRDLDNDPSSAPRTRTFLQQWQAHEAHAQSDACT